MKVFMMHMIGHSSTSLGAAAGYAVARNLKGEEESEVVGWPLGMGP